MESHASSGNPPIFLTDSRMTEPILLTMKKSNVKVCHYMKLGSYLPLEFVNILLRGHMNANELKDFIEQLKHSKGHSQYNNEDQRC